MPTSTQPGPFVLVGRQSGVAVIPADALLTRLHYYDGKFLRAEDLVAEQEYFRRLIAMSNQAGGPGVVHGFEVSLAGEGLRFAPGLAIDPAGRVLFHQQETTIKAQDLIDKTREAREREAADGSGSGTGGEFGPCEVSAPPGVAPDDVSAGTDVYLISVGYAEAMCGEEDVYGKLCEEACATGTDRPYAIDGVVFRADPLKGVPYPSPSKAFPPTGAHFRSRLASGYFACERARNPDSISRAGLLSAVWCAGAGATGGSVVPLGLLARSGTTNLFLDLWSVRRERMDGPPRRSWQWRMAMRPWDVFVAQILQFQCQLRDLFHDGAAAGGGGEDPCRDTRALLGEATKTLADLHEYLGRVAPTLAAPGVPAFTGGLAPIEGLVKKLNAAKDADPALSMNHLLIRGGIVEVPSAGYLPVIPGAAEPVNVQVRRLLGDGVDLRFCVVRPDFVPHALEEAQHMDRISLTAGLDNPASRPRVDVLVPEGEVVPVQVVPTGTGYEMTLNLLPTALVLLVRLIRPETTGAVAGGPAHAMLTTMAQPRGPGVSFRGAARGEALPSGGYAFHYAGAFLPPTPEGPPQFTLIELLRYSAVWLTMDAARDPFRLNRNDSTPVTGEMVLLVAQTLVRLRLSGNLQVTNTVPGGTTHRVTAHLSGTLTTHATAQNATNPVQRVVSISESVVLARDSSTPANPSIEVVLARPGFLGISPNLVSIRSTRNWTSPTVAKVDGALQLRAPDQPAGPSFTLVEVGGQVTPIYTGVQTVNPDVLRPDHPAHELAVVALRAIAAALNDPQFDDVAIRRLFPPPQPATGDLIVRARADWVLFHRRREKQCGLVETSPGQLLPRRFRVYHVPLPDGKARDALHTALETNSAPDIARFRPQPVDVVEFAPGIQSLDTPLVSVQEDWEGRVKNAVQIVYGAVATQGSAIDEGKDLAAARLATLVNGLAPVSPAAADLKLAALPAVPDASTITAAPNDGVMVLGTVALATTCHNVFRLVSTTQNVAAFSKKVSVTKAAEIGNLMTASKAEPLGKATFQQGTDQFFRPATEDIATAWVQAGDGKVSQVIVISQRPANAANPTADETARITSHLGQAARITGEVGPPVPTAKITHHPPQDTAALPGCPVVTVLVTPADD